MRKFFLYLFLAIMVGALFSVAYLYLFGKVELGGVGMLMLIHLGWMLASFLPVAYFSYRFSKAIVKAAEQDLLPYITAIFIPSVFTIIFLSLNLLRLSGLME